MNTPRQATLHLGRIETTAIRLGGATCGYVLLAASAVFLFNVSYEALRAGVFDAVVATMIGFAAATCLIGVLLIVAFARPREPQVRFATAVTGSLQPVPIEVRQARQ